MNKTINIGMAEDHVVLRQGLKSLLKDIDNVAVLFDVNNGQELLNTLETQQKPDIILLDIDMPIMDGTETLKHLSNLYPEIKVIMLTMHFSSGHIISSIRQGARAFLTKGSDIAEIMTAVNSVHSTGSYHSATVKEIIDAEVKLQNTENAMITKAGLTDREVEILKLLREGKHNSDIAHKFGIAARTVEWHRHNLIHKLKCSNTEELINWSQNLS